MLRRGVLGRGIPSAVGAIYLLQQVRDGTPLGRIIGQREESAIDIDAVLEVAAEMGIIMEVNAIPARLDLDDVHIRRAVEPSSG